MITFEPGHVRLTIDENQHSGGVNESVAHLLRLCRLNNCHRALVVSGRDELVYASLRSALRFTPSGSMGMMRLGIVIRRPGVVFPQDVQQTTKAAGVKCEVFSDEVAALRWLESS